MLRKLLDRQLDLTKEGKFLHKLKPLISGIDTFLYEPPLRTRQGPHIRDAVDLKRWMILVFLALLPCIIVAVWNSGMQKVIYTSTDLTLMREFMAASTSLSGYFSFTFANGLYWSILKVGLMAFLPVMIISYAVGGVWEALFASIRGHEISEGFLVTGILYALILPSTLPYWMIAVGVTAGVVIGKEIFGGNRDEHLKSRAHFQMLSLFYFSYEDDRRHLGRHKPYNHATQSSGDQSESPRN